MIASSWPIWFSYCYFLCSSVPYWPALITTILFAKRANQTSGEILRWRMKLMAVIWGASLLFQDFVWEPHVMAW